MLPISYGLSGERQFFVLVNLSESKHDSASIMQPFTSSAPLYAVFLRRFRDRFGSLELKIGSLESAKIIIGSLESEKSGPYKSIPGT